ncbi:MAG TPA: hypothetical protein VGB56_05900 [Flavisolibacter sp.]|jgi:hypothetical protein
MKLLQSIMIAGAAALMLPSCDRAQANVQTLISNDCGQTWQLIQAGQTIPKRMTQCELKTTIPGSPMVGESYFKTTFANNVKAQIDLDYEYEIVEAVKFLSEAKYLAKTDSDGDEVSGNSTRFESAENSIIDKRIKDIARSLLGNMDIVEFDQSDFETRLLDEVNKNLANRGVKLNFLSFVPEPSEQTAQAIDVAQAMKIYDSKNLTEAGKVIIANKAGATRITVTTAPAPARPVE